MPGQPHIAIVGCGLIGRAWAIAFARSGREVKLYDPDAAAPARAIAAIEGLLEELEANDLLMGRSPRQVRANLSIAESLEQVLRNAAYVQENGPEKLEIKKQIYAELDALSHPETILASSTSAILPSYFTESLKNRQRCLVVHPLNPPYLIPAAEIVPAPWTSPGIVERTRALLLEIGQTPLVMKKEFVGFIMNRLQGALLEEAFRLVADGYTTVEDIDAGLKEGLALRWSFAGPFETIDLNAPGGIRDYVARYEPNYRIQFETQKSRVEWGGPVLDEVESERRKYLPEESLGERQLWRDRRLMALAAHKRESDKRFGK
jgi:3-hydroxyacyl-CoA dehydrogenase